eukprot:15439433-Alexandrium_andersonii.AAC.1
MVVLGQRKTCNSKWQCSKPSRAVSGSFQHFPAVPSGVQRCPAVSSGVQRCPAVSSRFLQSSPGRDLPPVTRSRSCLT